MIVEITDDKVARGFLNSVPYEEHIPEWLPVCTDRTIILGWIDPHLVCCFPFNKYESEIEIHCACLREYRGKRAIKAAHAAFKWIFDNTQYTTIFAEIKHRHVEAFALMCGMNRVNGRFEVRKWAVL